MFFHEYDAVIFMFGQAGFVCYLQTNLAKLLCLQQIVQNCKNKEENIMKSFNYVITDEQGVHARPAGILVKEAKKYASKITISAGGKNAEATKLMAIMSMGIKKGTEITVSVEGDDEEAAAVEMEKFFKENL